MCIDIKNTIVLRKKLKTKRKEKYLYKEYKINYVHYLNDV